MPKEIAGPARRQFRNRPPPPAPIGLSGRTENPALPRKEEPVLAGFQLTATAAVDDQRQPAARMTHGSIGHRAAVSAAVARLLPSDNLGSAAVSRSTAPMV